MKLKTIFLAGICGILLFSCSSQQAVTNASPEQVAQILSEQEYLFNLQFVRPTGGRQRIVSGNYTMVVTKNKVEADLPYFGRAYNAPMGSDVGMKFTSKDFSYEMVSGKNDRKEITIRPRDVSDIQAVYLTVFPNGSSDLRILSNSRQAISYVGDIRSIPLPK